MGKFAVTTHWMGVYMVATVGGVVQPEDHRNQTEKWFQIFVKFHSERPINPSIFICVLPVVLS